MANQIEIHKMAIIDHTATSFVNRLFFIRFTLYNTKVCILTYFPLASFPFLMNFSDGWSFLSRDIMPSCKI